MGGGGGGLLNKRQSVSQVSEGITCLGIKQQPLTSCRVFSCLLFFFCSYIPVNIFFWVRLFFKHEPNGLCHSQSNCLSRLSAKGASSGLHRQTWLKNCLQNALWGLFKSTQAPDGWGLRYKMVAQAAGCAHKVSEGELTASFLWLPAYLKVDKTKATAGIEYLLCKIVGI